ncbi:MAG: ABC transporter permease [Chloroflexota bacterium]|nr:MAG: ABC transporter permease [Chloroflexota bacterium]
MVTNLQQVVRYRELIRNLTLRDLKVRYRNSLLGFLWAWGNPLMMTLVFTIVFQVLAPNSIANYPLFILIGWLAWSFTTSGISDGLGSIVANGNLVKKVWFPRIVLPASAVFANGLNFILAFPLIVVFILYYRIEIQPMLLLYLPIIFISQLALISGIAFLLSASNVYYRDTGVITGVLLTAWFFLTPVFYAVPQFTQDYSRLVYILNPMASIIESYRSILYGSTNGGPPAPPDMGFLLRTLITSFAILIIGYIAFTHLSKKFGEEL